MSWSYTWFRLRLHVTLERFCMEPFRVGTDRLPVYTISWNRSVQNPSFQSIHAWTVPNDSLSLHLSGIWKILEKIFPPYICCSKPQKNVLREQIFQSSSAILNWISPCRVSKRTWRERFWEFTRELFGSVPCGTYFLGGPVLVPLAVLYGTVPSVPV